MRSHNSLVLFPHVSLVLVHILLNHRSDESSVFPPPVKNGLAYFVGENSFHSAFEHWFAMLEPQMRKAMSAVVPSSTNNEAISSRWSSNRFTHVCSIDDDKPGGCRNEMSLHELSNRFSMIPPLMNLVFFAPFLPILSARTFRTLAIKSGFKPLVVT